MSIQFPKSPFSRFNSASAHGANAAPEYREPSRQSRFKPGGDAGPMPPRRAGAAGRPADSAAATDRRGPAPQSFAGRASAHARRPGAPPIVPAKPTVAHVLSKIPLHEVDRMTPVQVKQFTKLLGGKTFGVAPALLAQNWKLLRSRFNGPELKQLLLKKTADVMKFLTAPALPKSPAAQVLAAFQLHEIDRMNPAQMKQVVDILGGHAPGKGPEPRVENWQLLRQQFTGPELKHLLLNDTANVLKFLTASPTSPATPAMPAMASGPASNGGKPISLVGMKREEAFQALKGLGMSHAQLQEMRQDFLDQVNHGSGASGDALSAKYKAFVTDDLSQSGTLRSYAKLFVRPIADEVAAGKA